VLACTTEGGKLLHTPKLTTAENLQIRKANLTVQLDGSVSGKMNTVYAGSQYENQESLIGKSITEQHKLLKEAYNIDNIDFEAVSFAQKKDISPKLTEEVSINIRNYAPVNGNKMFLQLNAFNLRRSIPEIKNRTLPVYINRGYTDEDSIVYTLPDNVITELIIGQDKAFKSPFGEYVCKASLVGNKLTYYRKFILNDGTFPAAQYNEFSKFINDVNAADYLKLALSLKK
jgi:hypothetical protein